MLNYLQDTIRSDISISIHQCAWFSVCPMLSHERAVKRIGRYLILFLILKTNKGLECFVDTNFAGGWSKDDDNDPDSVPSRTGFVIFYAGFSMM